MEDWQHKVALVTASSVRQIVTVIGDIRGKSGTAGTTGQNTRHLRPAGHSVYDKHRNKTVNQIVTRQLDKDEDSMEDLKNKVAIITGSSSGIGEGTAVLFAKLGCHLTLTGRDQDRLKAVVQRCVEAGCPADKIVTVIGDIRDKVVRQELLDKTLATFGRLDILVNNAGLLHMCPVSETSMEAYDELMEVNVKAGFFLSKLVAPELIKTKGNIVNVSSYVGTSPSARHPAYCMTKAAMNMFTQCLALELAPKGVRVNSINPGFVPTRIWSRTQAIALTDQQIAEGLKMAAKMHPLNRVCQPEEIGNTIAFLASDMSSFTTGSLVYVDGGIHCGQVPVSASAAGK